MKNLLFFFGFSLFVLCCAIQFSFNTSDNYVLDKEKSIVNWKAEKIGGEHAGTILIREGNLEFEQSKLIAGSIKMDMQSIVITDIKNEKNNAKLQDVLESESFFNVKNHPTAKFTIANVVTSTENEYFVNGDLEIKGISKRIAFPLMVLAMNDKTFHAMGNIKIDRTDFDIRYDSDGIFDALGDKIIYDEFNIDFEIFANLLD